MMKQQLEIINNRIAKAAKRSGRSGNSIRIVAAVKNQGFAKVNQAIENGISLIGHNYYQEAAAELPNYIRRKEITLHMIGHLQTRKAHKAIELFDVIETVDNQKLVFLLSRKAVELNKTIGALIQVNLSGEPQKSGIAIQEVEPLAELTAKSQGMRLMGFMTMPPFFDDPEKARPYFAQLRELSNDLIRKGVVPESANELSMGMSGDFEAAIEEGATLVRIGTALFGGRDGN